MASRAHPSKVEEKGGPTLQVPRTRTRTHMRPRVLEITRGVEICLLDTLD